MEEKGGLKVLSHSFIYQTSMFCYMAGTVSDDSH